jgi:UDP-glucose 4-epimerase
MPDPQLDRPVLLLGGGGFLGGHIAEAILENGLRVRIFDRARTSSDNALPANVEFVEGDFGNRGDVAAAVDGCDIVVHLVSTTQPKSSNDDPVHDLQTNLIPTVRFLEVARQKGIKRVIFASSGGTIYGVPTRLPIREDDATRPVCSYGIHKLGVECYLHLYHSLYGMDYRVLRMSNPYGERQRVDSSQGAVAVFLDRALRRQVIEIWGDGSVVRDYVHVKDVARAFLLAAKHTGPYKIFNIGSGHGVALNDLLTAIESLLGRNVERCYLPSRSFDVPVNVLDISRAADYLGWQPELTLEAGLAETMRWLQSERVEQP